MFDTRCSFWQIIVAVLRPIGRRVACVAIHRQEPDMSRLIPAKAAVVCFVAALTLAAPAQAADHRITVYNSLNFDVVSLKLRKGEVTGFQKLPPGYGIVVGVSLDDGSCGGWLVARYPAGDAAQALIDICSGGKFVVTLNAGAGGTGSGRDLAIKPLN